MAAASQKSVFLPALPFAKIKASVRTDGEAIREGMVSFITSLNAVEESGHQVTFFGKSFAVNINGLKVVVSADTAFAANEKARSGATGRRRGQTTLIVNLEPLRLELSARNMLGLAGNDPVNLGLQSERELPLQNAGVPFDAVFRQLCALIDCFREQPKVLERLGIDELLCRNIALMLRPNLFFATAKPECDKPLRRTLDPVCRFIQEHLDQRVTLSDLERISGLSARNLQYAFLQRFGWTPMQWLRDERLNLARQRLTTAKPGDSVTSIALSCGISNHGAFAANYRKRFGELPSSTLTRVLASP